MKIKHVCFIALLVFAGCKKTDDEQNTPAGVDQPQLEKNIISDFAGVVANPNYADIQVKAGLLETSVQLLASAQTDANLTAAQNAWRSVRAPWERSEGFLFGPIEDFNYDPATDTWPLNTTDLDAVIAGSSQLTTADIDALPESQKGFHAIEYILFGAGGTQAAANITARQLTYLISLTNSLHNTMTNLQNSWTVNGYGEEWITAGSGSTRFSSRHEALTTLVTAMAGICEEVGQGKMEDPLVGPDSTLEESQFSHNSTADFKNNMIGVQNAYLGKYNSDGHGLNELVNLKNASLDQKIQSQINGVVAGFDLINANYGLAVYTQHTIITDQQARIEELKETLENELLPGIQQWVTE